MASQTITGPDLQYTQDNKRCYAYSGLYPATSTDGRVVLDFTTGSGYIDAIIQINAAVDDDSGLYAFSFSIIKFNEIGIAVLATSDSNMDGPSIVNQSIIIPPFTRFSATLDNEGTGADQYCSIILTGRVYEHLPVRN